MSRKIVILISYIIFDIINFGLPLSSFSEEIGQKKRIDE